MFVKGEFPQIYSEVPTICLGRLWFDQRGGFTWGKGHKMRAGNIPATAPQSAGARHGYSEDVKCIEDKLIRHKHCMHKDQRTLGTVK